MTSLHPTILLVHAHPDDEASTTGGVIARYSSEGTRIILVTCTNGELGDSPTGLAPDHDEHDVAEVVAHRMDELRASCEILGVDRLELLGYHDSGMMGWPQNDDPTCFWQTPVEVAGRRLADLMDEEQPDVVITYDENGFYGHPDHIQANRVTLAALEMTSATPKLYYTAVAKSAFERLRSLLAEAGVEAPGDVDNDGEEQEAVDIGTPDDQIGAAIDVAPFAPAKRAALEAHASQTSQSFFLTMPEALFDEIFSTEWFVRVIDPTDQVGVEDDLLDGIR